MLTTRIESTASSTRGSAADAGRRRHQVDRFDARVLVALVDLSVADQHRRPGVVMIGSSCSRRRGEQHARRRSGGRSLRCRGPSSFWQISRVCSPGIGAGRNSARGMCAYGAGLGLGGHRVVEQRMHHVGEQLPVQQRRDRPARRRRGSSARRAHRRAEARLRRRPCPFATSMPTPRRRDHRGRRAGRRDPSRRPAPRDRRRTAARSHTTRRPPRTGRRRARRDRRRQAASRSCAASVT